MPAKLKKSARELRIELPALSGRASLVAVAPSWDPKARTFEAVIASERPVLRSYYQVDEGTPFDEILGLEQGEFDLERFARGLAPLTDGHVWGRQSSTLQQHGVAVEGSLRFETIGGHRAAIARFQLIDPPKESDAFRDTERLIAGIAQSIFRSGSIGYRVTRLKDVTEPNMPRKRYRAIAWEGDHYAMVSVGADTTSSVRGKDPTPTVPCIVVSGEAMDEEVDPKDTTTEVEGGRDAEGGSPPPPKPEKKGTAKPDDETEVEGARSRGGATAVLDGDDDAEGDSRMSLAIAEALEREDRRRTGIIQAARTAGLNENHPKVQAMLGKRSITVESARSRMLDLLAEQDLGEISDRSPSVGRDRKHDSVLVGVRDALLQRGDVYRGEYSARTGKLEKEFKPSERASEFENMSLLEMGRALLEAHGHRNLHRLSKPELAERMLKFRAPIDYDAARSGPGGMLSSGDFPGITADVAHKVLRMAYSMAPATFAPLFRSTTVNDFKPVSNPQIGEFPSLDEVPEGGTYEATTTAEDGITYKAKKFGRMLRLTLEALLNDDTQAFDRIPMQMGNAARREESDQAWSLVTSNQMMGDGNQLFSAPHANDIAGVNPISVAALNVAFTALALMKGPDGQLLNVQPAYILAPNAMEATALQFTREITPDSAGNVNPYSGRVQPIIEPRLSLASTTKWYVTARPQDIDMGVIARLRGRNGPTVESREGWYQDGIEFKVSHIFAVALLEWRGFVRASQ